MENAALPTPVAVNPLVLLDKLVAAGHDPEKLQHAMDLAERWMRTRAEADFAAALAGFQRDCPQIKKNRKADRFMFASLDDIMAVCAPILSRYGIVVTFNSEQADDALKTTVRVRVGSHYEDKTFTVPVPKSLKVSEPQQYGACLAYAKRYAFCAAMNVVVTDEDDETLLGGTIDDTESMALKMDLEKITDLNNWSDAEANNFLARFLELAGVKAVEDLPRSKLTNARSWVKHKLQAAEAAARKGES